MPNRCNWSLLTPTATDVMVPLSFSSPPLFFRTFLPLKEKSGFGLKGQKDKVTVLRGCCHILSCLLNNTTAETYSHTFALAQYLIEYFPTMLAINCQPVDIISCLNEQLIILWSCSSAISYHISSLATFKLMLHMFL